MTTQDSDTRTVSREQLAAALYAELTTLPWDQAPTEHVRLYRAKADAIFAALPASQDSGLRAALDVDLVRKASNILDSLDGQADHPGPDHLVAVTVEVWRDAIRPVVRALRAALGASGSQEDPA